MQSQLNVVCLKSLLFCEILDSNGYQYNKRAVRQLILSFINEVTTVMGLLIITT
jgi:hypothetical protein